MEGRTYFDPSRKSFPIIIDQIVELVLPPMMIHLYYVIAGGRWEFRIPVH
jgi:hypothetical protein